MFKSHGRNSSLAVEGAALPGEVSGVFSGIAPAVVGGAAVCAAGVAAVDVDEVADGVAAGTVFVAATDALPAR